MEGGIIIDIQKEKKEEFFALSNKLIKWLNDNANPHAKIIIDYESAELLSGELVNVNKSYIKD